MNIGPMSVVLVVMMLSRLSLLFDGDVEVVDVTVMDEGEDAVGIVATSITM